MNDDDASDAAHTTDADVDTGADVELDTDDSEPEDTQDDTGPSPSEPREIVLFDDTRITSIGGEENFQNATAEFDWGEGPFERVVLTVDLQSTCYPFESWTQPPPGHNWPADCDAFDRNFEFTLDDPQEDGDSPAYEIVRAITPFGGPMQFEIDVTHLANHLPGEHRIRVHITTWSDGAGQVSGSAGGWNVSASLHVTEGQPPREVLDIVPLVNHSYRWDTEVAPIAFETPPGTTEAFIEYRVTGHGGAAPDRGACIGPAEEFCRRFHQVLIDGRARWIVEPWRDDCHTLCTMVSTPINHCQENPCGHPDSVRAPRANWCPGDITPPIIIDVDTLAEPGEHTFSYFIEDVKEGGSWRVSAVAYFFGD